ncbi:cysteine desulfurase/selenocysteine lyase [Methanomicrobium sp. W14]|uniref:aminotransferase class V-fold PLP-dependent enzyme n=1 Tax=Methanomicrobium sp. W14 TaxID=2817839 RepID=UPI001AE1B6B9|nr:aminotransferase class V-fold PLP-dependent enzyme [Methanomicrobium sp. W14]MBP2132372.1 cysteine desulfurase/selenocysteine lyase [Methanomicrobium sp. W14]
MRDPPVKKILYWCPKCNVPLIGSSCSCGSEAVKVPLLKPYEVRPALSADVALIKSLVNEKFGDASLSDIMLLNKSGGDDRAELVIMNGERFGWLVFSPVNRKYRFDIAPEGIKYVIGSATKGILDIEKDTGYSKSMGRIGGKRIQLNTFFPDGTYIVKYRSRYGTGIVRDDTVKIKELVAAEPATALNPGWKEAVRRNKNHLKNLEHTAIRTIKQHMNDRPCVNVSFSGGKDSTVALNLAGKAGVKKAFFIDTGLEFPETIEFVKSKGVDIIEKGGDFWKAVERAGPPSKDNRWCCKLLKLNPLKVYLSGIGPCVTVQGNRWYESWNRAGLDETNQNPANPLQLNISPIRGWRALEVYLYIWWQDLSINPLYEKGLERIGCYLCPAMLESEFEEMRSIHPDYTKRWDDFLEKWAEKKGYPEEFYEWGLWRWKALPPKMREICRDNDVEVNYDYTLKTGSFERKTPAGQKAGKTEEPPESRDSEDKKNSAGRPETVPVKVLESGNEVAACGYDVAAVRKDFPILGDVTYLDNAATGFSPEKVLDAVIDFEHNYRSNVGRGVHSLMQIASQKYWHAHEKAAKFIGGEDGVMVFTKNTTEAINMVAMGMSWQPGDRIITTVLEHHSNLLPWRALSKYGVSVDVIGLDSSYSPDLSELKRVISPKTKLVAVTHASNVLGVVVPVKEIAEICHENGVKLLVDGAQSTPHIPVNVADIGCDYFAFSGHKMLGPTGTGGLWMKMADLNPVFLGGGMVESVTKDGFVPEKGYRMYEAGTPNISGGIGLGAAVDYLSGIGMKNIRDYEESLTKRLIEGLESIPGVTVYTAKDPKMRIGVVSFTIDGLHPHEVAQMLDENADIMVRSGNHCCQPLMECLGLKEGTVRASIGLYNTVHEIDLLVASVKEIVS